LPDYFLKDKIYYIVFFDIFQEVFEKNSFPQN
jgi:hypothetical protein